MDLRRFANENNMRILGPKKAYDSNLANIGSLWAKKHSNEAFDAYLENVYKLFFSRKLEIDQFSEIVKQLNEVHVSVEDFQEFVDGEGKTLMNEIAHSAVEKGIFGVPTWLFEDNEFFFGQDRYEQVEAKLARAGYANSLYIQNKKQQLTQQLNNLSKL